MRRALPSQLLRTLARKAKTAWLRYREWKLDPVRLIRVSIRKTANPSFVQIGSNDGCSNDPLHQILMENPAWPALLVEPIPWLFERLRQTYTGRPNTFLENAAVSDDLTGERPFYYLSAQAKVDLPELPYWFDQLGSFDRSHIFKHFGPEVEAYVTEAALPTLTLPGLLEKHRINRIDVLHIDAEGYDWNILRQLDWQKYRPAAILIEHVHLSEQAKGEAVRLLSRDYKILDLGEDFFCRRR